MKKMTQALTSSVAALALTLGAAAFVPATTSAVLAQQSNDQTEIQTDAEAEAGAETMTESAEGETTGEDVPAETTDAEQPMDDSASETAETPAMDGGSGAGDEAMSDETMSADAGSDEMFIAAQQEGELIVSEYMGAPVINSADETLGDINDVIVSEDGGVDAVVIGVGGFLGIGEKSVAVAFDALEIVDDPESDERRIVLETTREALEAAPAFRTLAALRAEQGAGDGMNQTMPDDGSAAMAPDGEGTTMAPEAEQPAGN